MRASRVTPRPNASVVAAIPPTTISSIGTQPSSPGYRPSTTSSVTIPAAIASGPITRAGVPPCMIRPTPAPTSAAVNGASCDT